MQRSIKCASLPRPTPKWLCPSPLFPFTRIYHIFIKRSQVSLVSRVARRIIQEGFLERDDQRCGETPNGSPGACLNVDDGEGVARGAAIELMTLRLAWCKDVIDSGLDAISKQAMLTSLDLAGCRQVTDRGLQFTATLPILRSLKLGSCSNITDRGMEEVEQMINLTYLGIGGCKQITDAGLRKLHRLRALQSLDLPWSNVSGLELSAFGTLTSLNLCGCQKITDTTLREIVAIGCTELTDVGVREVAKLSALTALDLSWCTKITETGLKFLEKLSNLRFLEIAGCMKISGKAKHAALQRLCLD